MIVAVDGVVFDFVEDIFIGRVSIGTMGKTQALIRVGEFIREVHREIHRHDGSIPAGTDDVEVELIFRQKWIPAHVIGIGDDIVDISLHIGIGASDLDAVLSIFRVGLILRVYIDIGDVYPVLVRRSVFSFNVIPQRDGPDDVVLEGVIIVVDRQLFDDIKSIVLIDGDIHIIVIDVVAVAVGIDLRRKERQDQKEQRQKESSFKCLRIRP